MNSHQHSLAQHSGAPQPKHFPPRVWIACLASYNAGRLHGRWCDATDPDELREGIEGVLESSPEPNAEEYAIHDYDGFPLGVVDEWPDLDELCELGAAIHEHGLALAQAAFEVSDSWADVPTTIEEHFGGIHDSPADWAEQHADDSGDAPPERWARYIDWEAYARDCELDGSVSFVSEGGSTYVFWTG